MNMGKLHLNSDSTADSSLSRYLIARKAAALTSVASWNKADFKHLNTSSNVIVSSSLFERHKRLNSFKLDRHCCLVLDELNLFNMLIIFT